MYSRLIMVAVAIALVACSENKSDVKKGVPQVPATLAFNKPAVGPNLTKEQVKEIQNAFSKKSTMMLPPGDLIFKPKDMSLDEYKRRESELQMQDGNSYAFLKAINANCAKGRPTSTIEATFSTDGDMNIENIRTNDKMSMSSSVLIGQKNSCPVDVGGQSSLGAKVEHIDQAAHQATASLSAGLNMNFRSLDDRYSQLLATRGLILQTTISGLGTIADTQGRALVNFNLNGSFLSLADEIPVSLNYQILSRLKKDESSKELSYLNDGNEVIMSGLVKMKTFEARIDMHQLVDLNGQISSEELYLNGHLTTAEELQKLFGSDNPMISPQKNTALQVLN